MRADSPVRTPRGPWRSLRAGVMWWGCAGAATATGCASEGTRASQTSTGESPADKHYDVAVGSFHNGLYEDAKMQLSKALAVDPDHADSLYMRGVLELNEGKNIVDAIEIEQCLQDAASEQQRTSAERLHRSAATSFAQAAEHFPEGAAGRGRAFNSIAVVSLFFHENQAAIQSARQALSEQFYTDRYSALANLGWAYYQKGDLVGATAELRQAVLINPDYCVAHYRLAQVYLDNGLADRSLEHALAVVENDRCPIQDAYRIAAAAALRVGDAQQGERLLQRCVDLAPRSCLANDCRKLLGPAGTPQAPTPLAHASARHGN